MPPKKQVAPKNTQESCHRDGKDLNEKTGRCVKKCGPLQVRDRETGKCAKPVRARQSPAAVPRAKSAKRTRADVPRAKSAKTARAPKNTQESCDRDGKDLNVKTGRCVKKCGPLQVRDRETGKCAKPVASGTKKARKTKAKTQTPEPASLSFDNYQPVVPPAQFRPKINPPPTVKRSLQEQITSNEVQFRPNINPPSTVKRSLQEQITSNEVQFRPKINPPSTVKRSLQEQITTNEIDKTKSLLDFVKKHSTKVNDDKIKTKMDNILKEFRSKRRDLDEDDVKRLEERSKQLSDEMKKLDSLIDENVANNVIINKQEKVAEKIDNFEDEVEQLPSWRSPQIELSPSSSPKFNGIFTRKSRRPQPYQQFKVPSKKQILLLKDKSASAPSFTTAKSSRSSSSSYKTPQGSRTRKSPRIVKLNSPQVKYVMNFTKRKLQRDDFNKNLAKQIEQQRQRMMTKRSLQQQITTEEIDETEKNLKIRMENIHKELRSKINNKDLNKNEAEQLQKRVKNISAEIKELDDLMATNVANGDIAEKQENVADEIDKLESKVEQKSPSPQRFKSKHRSAYSRKSRPPQPYGKAKDQLLLGYEPSNKQLVEQYGLKSHEKRPRDKGNSPELSPSSTPESPSNTMMDFFTGNWK
jgi:hypothetical protein